MDGTRPLPSPPIEIAHSRGVERSFSETVSQIEGALEAEGFGVLCRIDVQATLRQKLGMSMRPYLILGACHPPLAHRALNTEPRVGVMLPCNVVVREDEHGATWVEAINAGNLAHLFPRSALDEVAEEVDRRLRRVLDAL